MAKTPGDSRDTSYDAVGDTAKTSGDSRDTSYDAVGDTCLRVNRSTEMPLVQGHTVRSSRTRFQAGTEIASTFLPRAGRLRESRVSNAPARPGLPTYSFPTLELMALSGPCITAQPLAPDWHTAGSLHPTVSGDQALPITPPPATRLRISRVPRSQLQDCPISCDAFQSRFPGSVANLLSPSLGHEVQVYQGAAHAQLRCAHWCAE